MRYFSFHYRTGRPGRLGRAALAALAAGAIVLAAAGCGHAPSARPETVVLAASATANEPGPELAAPDLALLTRAAATSTDAVAYVVSAATGEPTRVVLTPLRADGQVEFGPRRQQLIAQNVGDVQRVLAAQAATRPFDLLGVIAAAVRAATPPGTLLVLSSGLSTAGAFRLQDIGWYANPATVAAQLKRQGELPDLTGWTVVFSGLGTVAGRQPPLPLPQRTTLTAYWMAICRAAGAAACRADNLTRPDPPSRSTVPVPVVGMPTVQAIRGPRGDQDVVVPDDLFFTLASARLLPGADSVLRPLAAKAIRFGLLVSVQGQASPDGSATFNAELAQARAQAIAARLRALGVPARQFVRVAGIGTAGLTIRACERDGQFEESLCARLRRVVIALTPPGAGTSTPKGAGHDRY
jgi:outer membrane protein OmpA-like peptidoglycan-associated protein